MYDYDPDGWMKMIDAWIADPKKIRHIAEIDFWVEHLELFDRNGKPVSQPSPRLLVSFKGA